MTAPISEKNQIVVSAKIRRQDGAAQGGKSKKRPHNKGLVDLLLKCPVKGFFVPFESSETTDTIKSPFE